MARAFKELTGNITKLNEPHFVADRGLWVMMVKENDRWIASGLRILRDFSDTVTPAEIRPTHRISRVRSKHRGFIAFSIKPLVETPVANCFIAKELSRLSAKIGRGYDTLLRKY